MPKVEDGLIEYSNQERREMQEHGLCLTCDNHETCQVRRDNTQVMAGWRAHEKHLKLIVKYCSSHEVQGVKTFGIRGT